MPRRLRNSVFAELLLVALVYVVGIFVVWRYYMVLDVPTWYATPEGGQVRPRLAGWWYFLVSLPFFQFLLLRGISGCSSGRDSSGRPHASPWRIRRCIRTRSRHRLPVGIRPRVRAPVVGARRAARRHARQCHFLRGRGADELPTSRSWRTPRSWVFVIVGPMLVFMPPLAAVKRNGLREYSQFARRYADEFTQKWLRDIPPRERNHSSAAPISSPWRTSDNSFDSVRSMSVVPVSRATIVQLVVVVLLPLVPLLLT
jgi:hypothetical protein